MEPRFSSYVITSIHETERIPFVVQIKSALPNVKQVEAIYPSSTRVPYLKKLQFKSKERGGRALTAGEIGLILTSRMIWRDILQRAQDDQEHFLILESDSKINDIELLTSKFQALTRGYDFFLWGSWQGHLRILRSKRKRVDKKYTYGEAFMRSIAGTYGYSLNRKAAATLLELTGKIAYPVDEFKRYVAPGTLHFGGIVPEVISIHKALPTTIGRPANAAVERLIMFVFDIRNYILSMLR